ncbi:MAG TPA: permease-like cell division protein FtsX [Trueperaceae bacterium]|nr:permease-like cell division protein FtsX [Trueperaceae bacterium]
MMYAFLQAMRAIRGNWVASVSTITTMTLSLTILVGFSLLSVNLNNALASLQGELEVAAYLQDGANVQQLTATIRAWPEVERLDFVSKSQALAEMVADLPSLERAAGLVENPLPDTLHLRLYDPAQTSLVRLRLEQLPGVQEVDDSSGAVATFLALNDVLRIGGSILIVVLLSAALFAIVNSIRAAITARKEEIDVMRLVGAKRGFIRLPFLFEGFLLGLISAVLALGLAIPAYQVAVMRLSEQFAFVPFVRDPALLGWISGLLALLAMLVGLVGSAIAVSQHLREEN